MKLEPPETVSLQDAFQKFRQKRLNQIKSTKQMLQKPLEERSNPERLEILRKRFVSQAMIYLGVPYAKKYHEKGTQDYDAPFFLDCCALVRRVLSDMKNELGFRVGRWNQAYQFDTLPITIEKEEDMKPGDLVFISGVYFNPQRKKQKHNMVHVEIWLGDGEKTIGARYHKGRVQIHDSYKFVSKSYHSMVYHFKSIDTWLNGICRSFCSEHAWTRSKYLNHGKKSIFKAQSKIDSDSESAGDSDNEDDQIKSQTAAGLFKESNSIAEDMNVHVESNSKLINQDEETLPVHDQRYVNDSKQENYINEGDLAGNFLIKSQVDSEGQDSSAICPNHHKEGSRLLLGPRDESTHRMTSAERCCCLEENETIAANGLDFDRENFDTHQRFECYHSSCKLSECSECYSGCNCIEVCYCGCAVCELTNNTELCAISVRDFSQCNENDCRMVAPEEKDKKQGSKPKEQAAKRTQNGSVHSMQNRSVRRSRSKSPSKSPSKQPSVMTSSTSRGRKKAAPKFYIGGNNGVALVEKPLLDKGWQRIDDNKDLSYYMKWVECKSNIDYKSFRPGEQLVNHIPNAGCLTTKTGLMKTLHDYEKTLSRAPADASSKMNICEFYPETHKIESRYDLEKFCHGFKDGDTWICKPGGLNQGKGIFLARNAKQLRRELAEKFQESSSRSHRSTRIIARYIENPLLLNGCKFDIRVYMLIASTTPYLVLYHNGYVRVACETYSKESTEITSHLTNQYVQKTHPEYSQKKDESVWTFERLNSYVQEHYKESKGLVDDWVLTDMTDRIKDIILLCFKSVQYQLERKCGYFDLIGFDFMIDDNMKVWLLEANVNPALFTNNEPLRQVIPGIVEETLKIVIEAFENKCNKKKVNPMESVKTFDVLFDEERKILFQTARKTEKDLADSTRGKKLEINGSKEPDE